MQLPIRNPLTLATSLALLLAACSEPFYVGGIQIREPDLDRWVGAVKEAELNTVQVTVYARQEAWNSPNLHFDAEADWLVPEIRAAKEARLKVVLILRVALDHAFYENRFLWHGLIMPRTEEDVEEWFRHYGEFASHWATIAEREGVDVLGISSEMNSLASTVATDRLPNLESYYLDPEKLLHYREAVLRHSHRIDPKTLWGAWDETFATVEDYLQEQSTAHGAWAAEVGFGGDLEQVNRRRKLLDSSWTRLIHQLREVYSGRLTYAANFDQYQSVGFWDHLDIVSINAYFPLRRDPSETQDQATLYPLFVEAWSRILREIQAFRESTGIPQKPVFFTELGYTSRANSTLRPWAGDGFDLVGPWEDPELMIFRDQPWEPVERVLAVRALHDATHSLHQELEEDLLYGLLYWKLSTQSEHRDIEPFVLILDPDSGDPLLEELRRFGD